MRNFRVTIDLNDGLIRIKDPERKYEMKPNKKILINQAKMPIFPGRKVKLKPHQAVIATIRMRNLNELSNDRQVCLIPAEATTVTIQGGKKLGYALPLSTEYQSVENSKKYEVAECPLHANQGCILKRISELKSSKKSCFQ